MLLLAGLLGMMAVGATAFFGFDIGSDEAEDEMLNMPLPDNNGTDDLLSDTDASEPSDVPPDPPDPPEDSGDTPYPEWQITMGQPGADTIDGSSANDQINGGDGDDQIFGGFGDDQLFGSAGVDTIDGQSGDDTLHGGDEDDRLVGRAGHDQMFGHNGADTLIGSDGDDSLVGGAGNDVLLGQDGADALHGDLADDLLQGGRGADTLFGGWGNDTISGVVDDPDMPGLQDLDENDYLNGGGGDDLILAGRDDIISTGDGADTVALGDWLSQDHQAQITDFSVTEDSLMVIYNDDADPDPEVTLEQDEEHQTRQHVVLNGMRVAAVDGADGLTLDHITLIAESTLASGLPA